MFCYFVVCMMLKTTTTLKNRRQDLDGFFLNVELTKILSPTIVWHFFDVLSANSKRHGDPLFMDEFWYFSAKCVEFDFEIFQFFDQSSNQTVFDKKKNNSRQENSFLVDIVGRTISPWLWSGPLEVEWFFYLFTI